MYIPVSHTEIFFKFENMYIHENVSMFIVMFYKCRSIGKLGMMVVPTTFSSIFPFIIICTKRVMGLRKHVKVSTLM